MDDVRACRLSGLGGRAVRDHFHPDLHQQPDGDVTWNGGLLDRVFASNSPVELDTGRAILRLSSTGFDQWVVWNPGVADAQAIQDLPDADWQRFVCVEPVVVLTPHLLAPGQCFVGSLRVERIDRADPASVDFVIPPAKA